MIANNFTESFKQGTKIEHQFAKLMISNGFLIKKSTENQDMKDHYDLILTKDNIEYLVDVKAMKRLRRSDTFPNENIHYVELKNVLGQLGWLYGKATHIAFELNDYFVMVDISDLQALIARKVKKVLVSQPTLYELYQREGRNDVITLVKTIDLMAIAYKVFHK